MHGGSRTAKGLILAAVLVAAAVTAAIAWSGWASGDGLIITFYGVPLGCACLFASWVERGIRGFVAPLVIGVAAAGLLVLSLPAVWAPPVVMTADLLLPVPPLLLLLAALASWRHRLPAGAGARAG